ncbi:MAG: hypothetical protein IJN29_09115 [Akkermansia sp.]|nr:hypothetical protein [Akkermansia sp.]
MNLIHTLTGVLALTLSALAQSEQLNFLIEPGAFRPGNFSTPTPDEARSAALHAKAEETKQAVQMGMAPLAEQMAAEQAAAYADMRRSTGKKHTDRLRNLVNKSETLRQHLESKAKEGIIPARESLAAHITAAYYTAALKEDAASADSLLKAAEAYRQEMEQSYKNGLSDRAEVLVAEITFQEATLLHSRGKNAEATAKKYKELAELLTTRARNGFASAQPAEQAAEACRLFEREWTEFRARRHPGVKRPGRIPHKVRQ